MGRGRLEAFSNGVIAVAITLLVLNLFLPGPGHGPLLDQLGQRWPSFVAYVIGFFVIGIIWVNHHALLRNIAVVDRTLLFPTLVFVSAGRSPQRLDAERGSAASAGLNSRRGDSNSRPKVEWLLQLLRHPAHAQTRPRSC